MLNRKFQYCLLVPSFSKTVIQGSEDIKLVLKTKKIQQRFDLFFKAFFVL